MANIQLKGGKTALVDDKDFDWLNQWKWRAGNSHGRFYVVRTCRISPKKIVHVSMHRLILKLGKEDLGVDHINGNGLDNRRSNLRLATTQQNGFNRTKLSVANKSGTTGVYWHKTTRRWRARIKFDYRHIWSRNFRNKEEAIAARREAEKQYFGEFAPFA